MTDPPESRGPPPPPPPGAPGSPPPPRLSGSAPGDPQATSAEAEQSATNWLTDFAGLPPIGWTPVTVLLGIAVAVGITFFGTFPVALLDPELQSTAANDAAQLMVAVGLAGAALIFALIDAGGRLSEALRRLGFRRFALSVLGLAVLAWLGYVALAAVTSPLLQPEQQDITREIGTDGGGALSVIVGGLLIVVAAPVSEEVFFRGFMFAGLRKRLPIWPAALISAAVWGSLHLPGGNIGVALQLTIFGVVLAWLYERSGTLWATITAHAINNTIAFVLLTTDAL